MTLEEYKCLERQAAEKNDVNVHSHWDNDIMASVANDMPTDALLYTKHNRHRFNDRWLNIVDNELSYRALTDAIWSSDENNI